MDIPEELKRRDERLVAIARAKEEIQARAQERFEREQAEFDARQEKREAHEKETGKKPRGKAPNPPVPGPQAKDQVNLTDEESRIMPTASGGFEQAYNAQAGVDVKTHLIVAQHITQHTNDKQEIEPALERLLANYRKPLARLKTFWPIRVTSARPISRSVRKRASFPSSLQAERNTIAL